MKDVESPIDLRNYADAFEWQETANVKRPWRKYFFSYYSDLVAIGFDEINDEHKIFSGHIDLFI